MNKFIYTFILVLTLFAGNLKAQTVYITESGKKYHSKNCDVAKTGKKGIELSEAKKQGYEACKVCKPITTVDDSKKKKETDKLKK